MGDVEDEIKKAQQERLAFKATLSTKSVSYDEDIYGGGGGRVSTSEYNTELLEEEDAPPPSTSSGGSRYSSESREIVRKALSSYTAPKHLLESRPKADAKEDIDPMQEFKRKTVAEREDEYRARWRKRKLSPPRVMAFGKDAAPSEGARTYREIMQEQQLEKEKKELMRKIQKKKEEEEEERKRELKDRNHGTLWDVKDENTERSANPRSNTSTVTTGKWVINVIKNGQKIGEPIFLIPETTPTFTIGRDRASNLPIDHPSCSKQHAKITYKKQGNYIFPLLTDLGSTNLTKINGTKIEAHKGHPLKAGDTVTFGGSTREYTFMQE
eukprot:Phypoly_transcript_09358.p1 GENE.Phypoly_transcript_09358~~Phypoly_transcript_09358.p1  ORF type:complete len:326 (+),score=69.52 Phypoly_transcript_09358:150-1127(+)